MQSQKWDACSVSSRAMGGAARSGCPSSLLELIPHGNQVPLSLHIPVSPLLGFWRLFLQGKVIKLTSGAYITAHPPKRKF